MFWIKYLLTAGMMHLVENKALSRPSAPDSDGRCRDGYLNKKLSICCSLCEPGFHQKNACTVTMDTVCERCNDGFVLEKSNRANNCFKCRQCREDRNLIYTQSCSTSSDAMCECKNGTYCSLRESGMCSECTDLTACPPGQSVSKQDFEDSDVSCSPCPHGTFSDKPNTETCQQHTDCESQGKDTLYPGTATSDRKCGQILRLPQYTPGIPTAPSTTAPSTTAPSTITPSTTRTQATSTTFITSNTRMSPSIRNSKTTEYKDSVGIIAGVFSAVVLVAIIGLLAFFFIRNRNGDTNNNIKKETSKPLHSTSVLSQQGSCYSHPRPEQQCLLGEKDSCNPSLSSSSSSSSGSTDHRSPGDPEHAAHSLGPVIHDSREGSVHHDNPQASSTSFKFEISATFSTTTQLPPGTYLCPVLTTPTTDSTSSNHDLPLSKEEERLDPIKEAHAAVQESGKMVC